MTLFQIISYIVQTWIEMLRGVLYFHFITLWRLAMLPIAALSLPARAIAALYRERAMEIQVRRIKTELENILWYTKELKEQLRTAVQDRKMMEVMLMELENEHGEAIRHIELLVKEVHDLKDEMRKLKEVRGKRSCDNGNEANIQNVDKLTFSQNPERTKGMRRRGIETALHEISKPNISDIISNGTSNGDIVAKLRKTALFRSLFSAILSVIVGITAWEAKDPCIPLVMALFTVVSMSMMTVVRLFSTTKYKPASDAVALLSFNWFLLGALTYPMLPRVAQMLA